MGRSRFAPPSGEGVNEIRVCARHRLARAEWVMRPGLREQLGPAPDARKVFV